MEELEKQIEKTKQIIEDCEYEGKYINDFYVYTRYALKKISNYKQKLVGVSCIYAVR